LDALSTQIGWLHGLKTSEVDNPRAACNPELTSVFAEAVVHSDDIVAGELLLALITV
jgi:hypothetical protein